MTFQEYYLQKYYDKIQEIINEKPNAIFVILGQPELLLSSDERSLELQKHIADTDTFLKHGNEELFDDKWVKKLFLKFTQEEDDFIILSYPQYYYFNKRFVNNLFQERITFLNDNTRNVFPLKEEYFIENSNNDQEILNDFRPEELPEYQAEQFVIGNKYYYSLIKPTKELIDVFSEKEEIAKREISENYRLYDLDENDFALDLLMNDTISENALGQKFVVKHYDEKKPKHLIKQAEVINALLKNFGGELIALKEAPAAINLENQDHELEELLKKFWGENAEFWPFKIYKNPAINKETVEISQEVIVSRIIEEYKKAKSEKTPKDLFLTSPTGSGKSLIFQLPAFYISKQGDVSIIITPLISLMKDQVEAIKNKRKFTKVAYLNSEISLVERNNILNSIHNGEIDIVYLSPELLLSYDIKYFLGDRKLGLLVVDEAHLVTTWGRDFRVDYWFLGNYISKIRKYHNLKFPTLALTATAVFGGENDMVNDTIDSLNMYDPYKYIGEVKRKDITFIIKNEEIEGNYQNKKIEQTVEFIKKINRLNLKTLVYAPYTRHVDRIHEQVKEIAVKYHGKLDSENKQNAFDRFKNGDVNIMIATKAFGMGVDISDIRVVYHHAPSGLLPDYVQEIGRVARDPRLNGCATLNYSQKDLWFSKALYGISSIKKYQLQMTLDKLYKLFSQSNKKRNLLISVDDFAYIFRETPDNIDQKVFTALMMLEKDYYEKYPFKVIVVRPKKLFAQVFGRINNYDLAHLKRIYGKENFIEKYHEDDKTVVEIKLDEIWKNYFSRESFPMFKRKFFTQQIFEGKVEPFLKIKMVLSYPFGADIINGVLNIIKRVLYSFKRENRYFSEKDLYEKLYDAIHHSENELIRNFGQKSLVKRIVKYILNSFVKNAQDTTQNFIHKRRVNDNQGYQYYVANAHFESVFDSMISLFNRMFDNNRKKAVHYKPNKNEIIIKYIRLGELLDILNIGTFEIRGGDRPMVFVRINDPYKIEKDSKTENYENIILKKTRERHKISTEIFDHFFQNDFTNDERWEFIEDFFLGKSKEELIQNYKSQPIENTKDIVEIIQENNLCNQADDEKENKNLEVENIHKYPPENGKVYNENSLLTLDTIEGKKTFKISEWINKDPVSLHKVLQRKKVKKEGIIIKGNRDNLYNILIKRLQNHHRDYYKKIMGLKLEIDFPGLGRVEAIVPFHNNPVKFYKWWLKNNNIVYLSKINKIKLFNNVNKISPETLRKKDRDFLNNPNN